ncbi:MAG: cupin domain-containing protein [Comamonadaceae bacterium]|nr:cupin domain-containing protein [Comamonadaceae bacterium]
MKNKQGDAGETKASQSGGEGPEQLSTRLRQLRRQAGFSVKELAERSEVSVGMISQVERGLANPSVRILERLRIALDVPLTTLLEGDADATRGVPGPVADFVRRAAQRPHFKVTAGGLNKELLSPHGQHDLQFMIIHIPPHSRSKEILVGPGEKAGLILEGRITLAVGDRRETLDLGDSFQFDSNIPHGVDNPFEAPARVLWIMNTRPPVVHF